MKFFKKTRKLLVLSALMVTMLFAMAFQSSADGRGKPSRISAIGKRNLTVYTGSDFELKVQMTPRKANDNYLRWRILSGKRYIAFDDRDLRDDEIEFRALRAGTAKVRCYITGTKRYVDYKITVKNAPKKIRAASKTRQIVEVGDDFELKVKKYAGLGNKYLKWRIKNSKIIRFENRVKTGTEVDFEARNIGTTYIYCTNARTKQTITFKVTVVRNEDDDDDNDNDQDSSDIEKDSDKEEDDD